MKKWISRILVICLPLGLTACGKQVEETESQSKDAQPSMEESEPVDTAKEEETPDIQKTGQEHILIAYFSWADNTVVKDEEAAVQSALSHYGSIGDGGNFLSL